MENVLDGLVEIMKEANWEVRRPKESEEAVQFRRANGKPSLVVTVAVSEKDGSYLGAYKISSAFGKLLAGGNLKRDSPADAVISLASEMFSKLQERQNGSYIVPSLGKVYESYQPTD